MKDANPFAFAGVWERWTGEQPPVESCTIITTDANEVVRPLHDRMPVILDRRDYARWLDPAPVDPAALREMLRPFPAEAMVAVPANPFVNNAKNEGTDCLAEVESPK
jgi:putative SOS response-associated peptidase YedK